MLGRNGLALLLGVQASIAMAATNVLPFKEIDASGLQGHVVFDVAAGQVGAAVGTFDTTSLVAARQGAFNLAADGGDIYAVSHNRRSTFFLLPVLPPSPDDSAFQLKFPPRALIGELLAGTTPGVTLYVGADRNNDLLPQADEVICQIEATDSSATRCILGQDALQDPTVHGYWVMAAAPSGNTNVSYTAYLSAGLPFVAVPKDPNALAAITSLSEGDTLVTGPGEAASGAAFPLRMTWRLGPPSRRFYGALLMGSGPLGNLIDGAAAMVPFALDRTIPQDATSHPIMIDPATGAVGGGLAAPPYASITLQPHESQRRLFFDLPPSDTPYDSIEIDTLGFGFGTLVDADFYAVRTDFPPSSSDPIVAVAPDATTAAVTWRAQDFSAVIPHPASGRWYIVATSTSSALASFDIQFHDNLRDIGRASHPTIAPGQYFNPMRAGHGISISQASGQQLLLWYSYLDDGTPSWYIAQAAAPAANSGWWTAPLYRAAWNGSSGTPTQVGYVGLTPTATNRFMFTWYLEGAQGSEAFELLAPYNACPVSAGVATNFTGNWFPPAYAGSGVDVLALPDQQFDLFYLYDGLGLARWGVGSAPFAPSSTIDMLQSSGFCPSCAWTLVTTQALGTLTMNFANPSNGTLETNLQLRAPLSGSWNIAQPMLRLTGTSTCPQ